MCKRAKWFISLALVAIILFSATGTAAGAAAICPTYQEAYERMAALKTEYPEGMPWTNFTPYGKDGTLGDSYQWKGGKIKNADRGVGCAAFAFVLSDAAFGNLPARTMDQGSFTFDDVKVGNILRTNGNSHFVIVLQKSAGGVTVAEGNYNKSVHWGRAMSEAEVMDAAFLVTRYPANFVPAGADQAEEIVHSGTEGNLSWSLTKAGTLTISGSGAIPDFTESTFPSWMAYNDNISTIVIENGVTSIGRCAFYKSKALSVYIPDGVTSIGQSAFLESALITVTIPGSVKTIGNKAFYMCANLVSVSVSEGVTEIGEQSFRGCNALEYIDFPASITSVGDGAFTSCAKMTRVRFMSSNHPVHMGNNLFTQCWNLTSVTLPQGADCISDGMFASCTLLSSLYIPAGVSNIGEQPFVQTSLQAGSGISFGNSAAVWNSIGGRAALISMPNMHMEYNVAFDDPFAADPDDPGDLIVPDEPDDPLAGEDPCKDGHTGTADENGNCTICGKPMGAAPVDPDDPSEPDDPGEPDEPVNPTPDEHEHDWLKDWAHDMTHHWHECAGEGCPVTSVSQKDGYAEHDYSSWVIDTAASSSQNGSKHRDCAVCGYRQTDSIPATGGPVSNAGTGSSNSGGTGGGTSGVAPTQKPEDSATVTVTDPITGTKTETTKKPDGSSVVVVTQKDGTVAATTTDAAGKTEIEVKLSASAINTAAQRNQPVSLPITAVKAVRDVAEAPAITIRTENDVPVRVAVPVVSLSAGTVAVAVNADGSTNVVKASVPAGDSLVANLTNGTTVKVIDNSKSFSDIPAGVWSENAIAFVSARELFAGTSATTFSPESPMTRAMLMTVLARFDGVNTAGGATWYAKGVEWATAHGVSDGANPNTNITREQLVTMLWRYLGSPAAEGVLSGYTDAGQVSSYAREAMQWAVTSGIVSGFDDGRLAPRGQATRAQVAQILKNFIENVTLNPT